MRVDHLYLLAIHTNMGRDPIKMKETINAAEALFRRHSVKCGTAALIEVDALFAGDKLDAKILQTCGGNVPLGADLDGRSTHQKVSPDVSTSGSMPAGPSESNRKDDQTPTGIGKLTQRKDESRTVGLYLVFHSDGGGWAFDPGAAASTIKSVVPIELHASIEKISLFACEIAARGEDGGFSADEVIGMRIEKGSHGTKGGLQLMLTLMRELGNSGIHPKICGYDIAVFAGEGPPIKGELRGIVRRVNDEWQPVTHNDPDIDGRKLVVYKKGRQSLTPIRDKTLQSNTFRNLHKKVLRLEADGTISNALAGWSSLGS